jgi:4-diphosphocytidyl-2-C-methyl-D-erythritol kinase
VLLALNQLWSLHWPLERLLPLALQLGADVPFFIQAQHAWVEGVGEQITPIALPQALLNTPLAVLKPPVVVPTAAIFSSDQLQRATPCATVAAFLAEPKRFGHNDLQGPAMAYSNEVTEALEIMQSRFGNSRMTGSGSAVFSWVEPGAASSQSIQSFSAADVGLSDLWVGRLCRLLPDQQKIFADI